MTDLMKRGRLTPLRLAIACGLGLLAAVVPSGATSAESPPWARESSEPASGTPAQNQVAYRFPAGLKDGRCRPEMFEAGAIRGLQGVAGAIGAHRNLRGGKSGDIGETAIGTLLAAIGEKRPSRRVARDIEICVSQSFEHVPDRTTVAWSTSSRTVQFSVMPMRTLQTSDGRYCRQYTAKATLNGHAADVYGTACRQANGRWILID